MTSDKKKSNAAGKGAAKLTGIEQVAEFMSNLDHPRKPEIEAVLSYIKSSHPQLIPHIKWNAPSFQYQEEDRVTFNLRGKDFFLIIFHCGTKVKERTDKKPLIEDTTGLLEWVGSDRATVKLTNMDDVVAKKEMLGEVIAKWLEVN